MKRMKEFSSMMLRPVTYASFHLPESSSTSAWRTWKWCSLKFFKGVLYIQQPKDEMHTWAPTQGICCLVTVHHSSSSGPGGVCARTLLWKSELRFGRWRFKKRETKTEAQCSCLLPQKPKEICSSIRKVWWLDNTRAENLQRRTWISEQSPTRCRDTHSHHSVESVSNPKLHRRREKNLRKSTVTVAEAKSYFIRTICC